MLFHRVGGDQKYIEKLDKLKKDHRIPTIGHWAQMKTRNVYEYF